MTIGIKGKILWRAFNWSLVINPVPKEFEKAMRWFKTKIDEWHVDEGIWGNASGYVNLVG